jgi:hypothetical protein
VTVADGPDALDSCLCINQSSIGVWVRHISKQSPCSAPDQSTKIHMYRHALLPYTRLRASGITCLPHAYARRARRTLPRAQPNRRIIGCE